MGWGDQHFWGWGRERMGWKSFERMRVFFMCWGKDPSNPPPHDSCSSLSKLTFIRPFLFLFLFFCFPYLYKHLSPQS